MSFRYWYRSNGRETWVQTTRPPFDRRVALAFGGLLYRLARSDGNGRVQSAWKVLGWVLDARPVRLSPKTWAWGERE